jgi:hypothetical protein
MTTKRYFGIAATLVVLFMVPMISAEDESDPVTLTGEVTIHEEDENGEIVSIYLADTDRGNVLISEDGLWEEILDHVDERIEATGVLTKAGQLMFTYKITVTSFSPADYDGDE